MCTKFDASIFIGHRDMTKNPNSRWALPPSWIVQKLGFRGVYNPCIASIYLHTPNLMQIGLELAGIELFAYFQNGGRPPSWICFTPIMDNPLHSPWWAVFSLPMASNGIMIRSDATEILRFHDFTNLAGKCWFGPILGSFWEFWPPNYEVIYLTPKACIAVPSESRVLNYCLLKSVQRFLYVGLFKVSITLKTYWHNAERLYFTHMGRSTQ